MFICFHTRSTVCFTYPIIRVLSCQMDMRWDASHSKPLSREGRHTSRKSETCWQQVGWMKSTGEIERRWMRCCGQWLAWKDNTLPRWESTREDICDHILRRVTRRIMTSRCSQSLNRLNDGVIFTMQRDGKWCIHLVCFKLHVSLLKQAPTPKNKKNI